MDSLERDIMSCYGPLINRIKKFKGGDAYVLETIAQVGRKDVQVKQIELTSISSVANLLSQLKGNRL